MHQGSSRFFLQLSCAAVLVLAWASPALSTTVDLLLAQDKAPSGVVFEIVERDTQALDWAVPLVARETQRLRNKFPKLDIVVVSHGREMFALQTSGKHKANPVILEQVERLVKTDKVAVHVCGTHAGWRGLEAEAFVGFVDVAPSAPVQINNYRALDFVVVRLRKSE